MSDEHERFKVEVFALELTIEIHASAMITWNTKAVDFTVTALVEMAETVSDVRLNDLEHPDR
jgi:hypothetical protein